MSVRIYQLDNGGGAWWFWLCGRHLAKRELDGYAVKESKDPPREDLTCDDRALYPCGEKGEP